LLKGSVRLRVRYVLFINKMPFLLMPYPLVGISIRGGVWISERCGAAVGTSVVELLTIIIRPVAVLRK